ncbi:MAG: calcium-binding protein, partial [Pseudodonghicola sp.]
ARAVVRGTDASETLSGPAFDTTFDSGPGDDTIIGNSGDQTFLWGKGAGNDVIQSRAALDAAPEDRVVMQGLALSQVRFSRGDDGTAGGLRDLVITIKSTGETLTLDDQFGYQSAYLGRDGVDFIDFADATLTRADLAALAPITGTRRADELQGSTPVDVLDGGRGNDRLSGYDSGDLYLWRTGDGNDVISDYGTGGIDELQLLNLLPGGVSLSRDSGTGDLLITVARTGEVLRIAAPLAATPGQDDNIEIIRFADGTVLTVDDIAAAPFATTRGDDVIVGDGRGNVLTARGGDDTLAGLGGADIYTPTARGTTLIDDEGTTLGLGGLGGEEGLGAASGAGSDPSSGDLLDLSAYRRAEVSVSTARGLTDGIVIGLPGGGKVRIANQLTDATSGIETFRFADGDVPASAFLAEIDATEVTGTRGADRLSGTWRDEVFRPKAGDDLITLGGGQDLVVIAGKSGKDAVFGAQMGQSGDSIDFTSTPFDSFAALLAAARDTARGVRITVDASTSLTLAGLKVSDLDPVNFGFGTAPISGTRKDDVLVGTAFADAIAAGGGNDTIVPGFGDDRVLAGAGDDIIRLRGGANDIDGGAGYDRVQFTGSDPARVDLAAGTVRIDGAVTTLSSIEAIDLGDGDDSATGSAAADALDMGGGDDTAAGGGGDDILIGGAGDDVLAGEAGNDVLVGGDGIDTAVFAGTAKNFLWAVSPDGLGHVFDLRATRPEGADAIVGIETLRFGNRDISLDTGSGGPSLAAIDTADFDVGGHDIVLSFDVRVRWSGDKPVLLIDPATNTEVGRLDPATDVSVSGKTVTLSLPDEIPRVTNISVIIGQGEIEDRQGNAFSGIGDPFTLQLAAQAAPSTPRVLTGTSGDDSLTGTAADEILKGRAGDDRLAGGGGDDDIDGGAGDDRLIGGTGADRLAGGAGDDLLTGGKNADLFVFSGSWGTDTVADFSPGTSGEMLSIDEVGTLRAFLNAATQVGADVLYDLGDDGRNTILLLDTDLSALTRNDFVFV